MFLWDDIAFLDLFLDGYLPKKQIELRHDSFDNAIKLFRRAFDLIVQDSSFLDWKANVNVSVRKLIFHAELPVLHKCTSRFFAVLQIDPDSRTRRR